MANILPLEAQKRVARMYRTRFVIAASIAIAGLSLLLALALIPSYLALSLAAPPIREAASGDRAMNPQIIARTQALVAKFGPALAATTSPTSLITEAINERPSGIALNHISYTAPQAGTEAQLQLVGTASRDKIAAYRDALESRPAFSNVSVPVSALVGSGSGDFSATLEIPGISKDF